MASNRENFDHLLLSIFHVPNSLPQDPAPDHEDPGDLHKSQSIYSSTIMTTLLDTRA